MSTALALRRRAATAPEAGPLDGDGMPRPIMSHERFAAECATLTMLRQAERLAKARVDLLTLERDLFGRGGMVPNGSQRDQQLRDRVTRLRAELREAEPPAAPPNKDDRPPEVSKALQLLAGEKVEPSASRETALADARRAVDVLTAAASAQDGVVTELRSALSAEVAAALLPQHQEVLRTMLEAARGLVAAVAVERAITSATILAGYETLPHILMRPLMLAGAFELGSEDQWDSQISNFRRVLEQREIIR